MSPAAEQHYQVVARRFRPQTFGEVVGQEAVVRSLRSALESGRVPHAFLFSGSRGVGKTTSARILARALNCEKGTSADPCGECNTCKSTLSGHNPDVVEIDAASHNLVDDIRELRGRVGFASMGSRYKVYILDEVHMLTRSAFNAFLKTLEEPPANVVFVLATTELHKVPETIRSRCQVLLFQRVDEGDIATRLRSICEAEGVSLADEVLDEIAASCRGGMRDAETALERVLPVAKEGGGSLDLEGYRSLVHRVGFDRTIEIVAQLLDGQAAPAMRFADEVVASGVDEREALGEVLEVLRSLMLIKVDGADTALVAHRGSLRERLQALADAAPLERIEAAIQAGLLGRERVRRFDDRRLVLELALLRIAQAGALPTLGDVVAAIESGVALPMGGALPPGEAGPAATAGATAAPAARIAPSGAVELRGALIAEIKQRKPMLVSTLETCELRGPDEHDRVHLKLRSERKMHRDRLEAQPLQQIIREALTEILGKPVSIVLHGVAEAAVDPGGEKAGIPEPSAQVKRVMDRFEGKVIDVDRPDRG